MSYLLFFSVTLKWALEMKFSFFLHKKKKKRKEKKSEGTILRLLNLHIAPPFLHLTSSCGPLPSGHPKDTGRGSAGTPRESMGAGLHLSIPQGDFGPRHSGSAAAEGL